MPSCSNGSGSVSVPPDQPIQAPSWVAQDRLQRGDQPAGDVRQSTDPSSLTTRSTGSRLATMTRSD